VAATTESVGGRPREARIERDVLAAARELLVEQGFAGLRVAAVAERAGTTKPALYRRWPSLPHLVYEAAFPDDVAVALHLGGDLRTDLYGIVVGVRDLFTSPVVSAALPGLIAEFARRPELHASLLQRFSGVFVDLDRRLLRAVQDGDARADVCADDLVQTVLGAVLAGIVFTPEGLDDGWADRLSTTLWKGIRP